ncbi:MAG TPA: M28 family peptidase [Gemmataceae bacterium]|nr:M28 family peptidase [Gemmataceae bacterium]
MPTQGWKRLLDGWPWFRGEGTSPIAAYSEFMPPPRLLRKPYGGEDLILHQTDDPWGWPIPEYEEALILRPGLEKIAQQIVGALVHLGHGQPAHGVSKIKLLDNPYWPDTLARQAGHLAHERFVVLLPLALSRTQDDKGRVLWTLFGGSEQGPARGFWRSFFISPKKEMPHEKALDFVRALLHSVYQEPLEELKDLHRAGFRILPAEGEFSLPYWQEEPLPSWTVPYLWSRERSVRGIKYLLTFRPFGKLPAAVQRAYFAGELHLLPFPGSLIFWGCPTYLRMQQTFPLAMQIPLLHLVGRHEGPHGIRVPQAGWLHEARPGKPDPGDFHGPIRNTYRRTNRWGRVHRDENELLIEGHEDKLLHVLFSTSTDDMGLYGKPMARNAQIWSHDFQLLLDGPNATSAEIQQVLRMLSEGGLFGYRFQFPPMRVGRHEVYWHRPLVAYLSTETEQPAVLPNAPGGYLTAYRENPTDLSRPLELWPRFLGRQPDVDAIELFSHIHEARPLQTTINIRKLLDTSRLLGDKPLPESFARQLLTLPRKETLDAWLDGLPARAADAERGGRLALELLRSRISRPEASKPTRKTIPPSLTFRSTARRTFELAYWKTIVNLAQGRYRNKNNADCVRDPATQAALCHHHRDLEALGNYLVTYYTQVIAAAGMTGKAVVGDLPFFWQTDFDFRAYGGWLNNQERNTHERDLIVMIPGRDCRRAVIMADHYDTAYMADHYEKAQGGNGAHLAAAGADDNHSATAALMLAAPLFLKLSRARQLGCDIWLIHLTGEEFPADCLGARHLCQGLVEGSLTMRTAAGNTRNLAGVRAQGVYVLDMVAHNNDHDRDVFQISPGTSRESMWLAYQAHLANETWNCSVESWNRRSSRRGRGRGKRSADPDRVPQTALHPRLSGEIRPHYDPRSTLYNTDGQIFSDAGIPVVLFMENYDINRSGYHDSHDTMANIDLDYGAGVAAIAIEAVARAATQKPDF